MNSDGPRLQYSPSALRRADRQLAQLADIHLEENGEVPTWLTAARYAVADARQEAEHD